MDEMRCAAELLFRYMMARYLCKEGTLAPGASDYLAREITHGRRVFDEILILTDTAPWIINDDKAADFFVAIINHHDGAMPEMDPAELTAWREYVWEDGPLPVAEPKMEPDAVMQSAGIGHLERNGDDRRAAKQAAD